MEVERLVEEENLKYLIIRLKKLRECIFNVKSEIKLLRIIKFFWGYNVFFYVIMDRKNGV